MPLSASRSCASAMVARTSTTPDMTADSVMKWAPIACGEESREAGLAGARRSPQQERREVPAGDAAAERPALADEVLLADELLEVARAHPRGERLALGRWLEERLRAGAAGSAPAWWHGPMVARGRAGRGGSRVRLRGRPDPSDVGDDPEDETMSTISDAADEGDAAARRGRRRRTPRRPDRECSRPGPAVGRGFGCDRRARSSGSPRPSAPRRRSGPRARRRGPPPRRSGSRAGAAAAVAQTGAAADVGRRWRGAALTRTGAAAADAFGHVRTGCLVWSRSPRGPRQRAPVARATAPADDRMTGRLLDSGDRLGLRGHPPEDPPIDLNALVQPNIGLIVVALSSPSSCWRSRSSSSLRRLEPSRGRGCAG